jgi:hypothetical protein
MECKVIKFLTIFLLSSLLILNLSWAQQIDYLQLFSAGTIPTKSDLKLGSDWICSNILSIPGYPVLSKNDKSYNFSLVESEENVLHIINNNNKVLKDYFLEEGELQATRDNLGDGYIHRDIVRTTAEGHLITAHQVKTIDTNEEFQTLDYLYCPFTQEIP